MALSAYVLAALFAQRRESAANLAHSNTMLERERDNKLLNAEALTAAIVHEVKQPLSRNRSKRQCRPAISWQDAT